MTRLNLLTVFALLAGLLGCESNPVDTKTGTVTQDDVRRDIDQAAKTTTEYANQSREEFQKGLATRLKDLEDQIASLRTRQGELQDEAKANWDRKLTALEAKRDAASSKLTEVRRASEDAWKDMQVGTQAAWDELDKACREAMSEFKTVTKSK